MQKDIKEAFQFKKKFTKQLMIIMENSFLMLLMSGDLKGLLRYCSNARETFHPVV